MGRGYVRKVHLVALLLEGVLELDPVDHSVSIEIVLIEGLQDDNMRLRLGNRQVTRSTLRRSVIWEIMPSAWPDSAITW